ncbi:hypothetical protein LPA49_04155 [Pseudoalteromonas sp. MB41]|uniref:hypothetical protein n=1 Tax=unclassified Pseudoalteromonas TaxID=194690 RepID=UPI0015D55A0F|nr:MULTISPECIES: hypothetical protein [unclassified Pseudoalteromonas]MCC9659747.1 hypothetical protein [Pseudoalteromonas sp. MB41]QLJ09783.1 hypothetical protein GZH31_08255 [Pseudoalteromonas sp. JSTW]
MSFYNAEFVITNCVDALQAHDLVEDIETLKIIGNDLIKMSDQLALKDIVLKYGDKKTA